MWGQSTNQMISVTFPNFKYSRYEVIIDFQNIME